MTKPAKSALPIPAFSSLLKQPILLLGFGFGSGLSRFGPGTVGTLLGLALFLPVLLWNETVAWMILLIGTLVGSYICGKSSDLLGVHDHGGIVWDEFVGIWLVLLCLPQQDWFYWLLAFGLFRVFDILKPWPILWVDHKVSGGFGIMLDDILAAVYTIALIWFGFWFLGI